MDSGDKSNLNERLLRSDDNNNEKNPKFVDTDVLTVYLAVSSTEDEEEESDVVDTNSDFGQEFPLNRTVKIKSISSDIGVKKGWSNQTVLAITCAAFAAFVTAEIVGALASGSLSLLGDAAAMSVDVFTYFTNMYAEYVKAKVGVLDRQTKILLEIVIPLFSVTALIGVTAYVTVDAMSVLIRKDEGDDVDILFLFGFASGNFLVDFISIGMFYVRGKTVFYHTAEFVHEESTKTIVFANQEPSDSMKKRIEKKKNLNMMSAFTHVSGDTLRTSSVFVAAMIATLMNEPSDACDAWAAIFVSATIIAIVVPLVREIYGACQELLF